MNPIIKKAIDRNQKTLSEHDSKLVIESAGIPFARQGLAADRDKAIALAGEIGYPVVMKGCSDKLTHKTEMGLVKVNIADDAGAAAAYDDLVSKGIEMDGVLVCEMISGQREFVAGLSRDAQFGPCVMFGLGGVFTEAFNDVSFRVAPLRHFDADDMVDEINAKALLGEFRGKPAADRELLRTILMGIGQLGLENKEIAEIDINPLILRDGKLMAVDALVVLQQGN